MGFLTPITVLGLSSGAVTPESVVSTRVSLEFPDIKSQYVSPSVILSAPLWNNSSYFLEVSPNNYSITTTVGFGPDTGSLSFSGTNINWLQLVGYHVEIYGPDLISLWEGFINSISMNIGGLSITRGPLLDIANHVTAKYTDFVTGDESYTSAVQDTVSQAAFGVRRRILSLGEVSGTNANLIRDGFLEDNSYPGINENVSFGGSESSVTIDVLGYAHILANDPFYDTRVGTYTAREKAIDALYLGWAITGILESDVSNIESNTLSVFQEDIDYRPRLDVINDIVALGGSSDNNRRIFMLERGRKPYLQAIPDSDLYSLDMKSNRLFYNGSTVKVDPWTILPGQWLEVTDLPLDFVDSSYKKSNFRNMFIENVTYNTPRDYTVSGGKISTLPQRLAKLGLGSI